MSDYLSSLFTDPAALLGLLASIVVLISMCFNTRTHRGERRMRLLNFIGSILSVIYGIILGPAGFGMIILNGTLTFVNLFYLIKNDKK